MQPVAPSGLTATFFLFTLLPPFLLVSAGFLAHRTARTLPRWKKPLQTATAAALLAAGLLVGLALAEGAFRLAVPGGYFHFRPVEGSSPEALVEPLSDGQAWWEYRDARGFGPDGIRTGLPRADDPALRVAVLGDSVTYGVYLDVEQSFPFLLGRRLEERCGSVDLVDLAVPGYSSLQERLSLERKGLARAPDIVIVGVFSNDMARYTLVGNMAYDIRLRDRDDVPAFSFLPFPDALNRFLVNQSVFYQYLTLKALAASDRATGEDVGQLEAAVSEMERIRGLSAAAGARLVVVLLPMLDQPWQAGEDDSTEHFYRRLREWSSTRPVTLVDLRPLLSDHPVESLRIDACCHLNPFGHQVVAALLFGQLEAAGLLDRCRQGKSQGGDVR
ncbi:MAG: SGNH/GDSL hydrolase family protein [Deltaproteobacteria bacterium]|nr:SGNH/GDSL hydrolase family protein [Deltaproteobacteria bacterium]